MSWVTVTHLAKDYVSNRRLLIKISTRKEALLCDKYFCATDYQINSPFLILAEHAYEPISSVMSLILRCLGINTKINHLLLCSKGDNHHQFEG
jgi:hypothetical protein